MRHILTEADRLKGERVRQERNVEGREARRLRRQAEIALLDRVLAEAAMPEWYPEGRCSQLDRDAG